MEHLPKPAHLNPFAIHDAHQAGFAGLSTWLDEFYGGFTNADKLSVLLSYWAYGFRCILEAYGLEGAREFSRSGYRSAVRFAYAHEYGIESNLSLRALNVGSVALSLIRYATTALLETAYLPGGRTQSLGNKVGLRLTRLAAMSTRSREDAARKRGLVRRLASVFTGYDSAEIEQMIDAALPAVFVAHQVPSLGRRTLRVDCSATAFMDFSGFEKLLLSDRRLHVIGRQHGGGYDMFLVDYFIEFEKQLCDEFIGWGLSPRNERQHRYRPGLSAVGPSTGDSRIVWVERARVPLGLYPMNPALYAQSNNKSILLYVASELRRMERLFYSLMYPGPMRSADYVGLEGDALSAPGSRGEMAIRASDILVFDSSAASLIHFCIEHSILFTVVMSRDDIPHFTEQKKEWLNVLRDAGLMFFDDERGRLSERLRELLDTRASVPDDVLDYHAKRFLGTSRD